MQCNANATLSQAQLDEKIKKIQSIFPHCKVMSTIDKGYKIKFLTQEQERRAFEFLYNDKDFGIAAVPERPATPDFTHMIKGYVESIVAFNVEEVKERVESSFAKLDEAEAALNSLRTGFETKIAEAESTVDKKIAGSVGDLNNRMDATLVDVEKVRATLANAQDQIVFAHDKIKGMYDELSLALTNTSNRLEEKILKMAEEVEAQILAGIRQQIALEVQAVRDERAAMVDSLISEKDAILSTLNEEKTAIVSTLSIESAKLKKIVDYFQSFPKE